MGSYGNIQTCIRTLIAANISAAENPTLSFHLKSARSHLLQIASELKAELKRLREKKS